jgi:hypothetical protein
VESRLLETLPQARRDAFLDSLSMLVQALAEAEQGAKKDA